MKALIPDIVVMDRCCCTYIVPELLDLHGVLVVVESEVQILLDHKIIFC